MSEERGKPRVDEEQILYARILAVGMYFGLFLLLVTFALYALGVIEPCVPLDQIAGYWHMNVHDYVEAVRTEHLQHDHTIVRWAWVSVLGYGDYLNYIGIAVLGAVTIACYLGIIPTLIKKNDAPYAIMAALEVTILVLAASGLLTAGH